MGYTPLYTFAVLHFSTVFVLFINHIPNSPGTFPPPDPAKRSAPVIPRFADGRISPVRATWVGCVTSGDAKQTRAILGDGVKVETCFFVDTQIGRVTGWPVSCNTRWYSISNFCLKQNLKVELLNDEVGGRRCFCLLLLSQVIGKLLYSKQFWVEKEKTKSIQGCESIEPFPMGSWSHRILGTPNHSLPLIVTLRIYFGLIACLLSRDKQQGLQLHDKW